jgi:hypothetical protein
MLPELARQRVRRARPAWPDRPRVENEGGQMLSSLAEQEGIRQLDMPPSDPIVFAHFEGIAPGVRRDLEDSPNAP